MRIQLSRFLFTAMLGGTLLASGGRSFANPEHERQRDDRREDRREEHRREERREDRREERREEYRDGRRVEVRDRHRPYEAPPAVRYERHADRRGYVWVNGGWDWRDGRYQWAPGRYER